MKIYNNLDLIRMAFKILEGDYIYENNDLQDVPLVKSLILGDIKHLVFEDIGARKSDGWDSVINLIKGEVQNG